MAPGSPADRLLAASKRAQPAAEANAALERTPNRYKEHRNGEDAADIHLSARARLAR
jgi:hypothetical protein